MYNDFMDETSKLFEFVFTPPSFRVFFSTPGRARASTSNKISNGLWAFDARRPQLF